MRRGRTGPRSAGDLHELMVGNAALRARNVGNRGVMELLLPLKGGKGGAPVPAGERLASRLDPAADGLTDRERFRRLVLTLLPDRLPGAGALRDEARLQASIIHRCHIGIRAQGWAVLPLMIPNGVTIPRRGETVEARKADKLPLIIGSRLKAMGLMPGAADLAFLVWPGRLCFMELKRPGETRWVKRDGRLVQERVGGGELSEGQEAFAALCALCGWPCPALDSEAAAVEALLGWGVAG